MRLTGSPGCAGLRRNCELARGASREERRTQNRGTNLPVTANSGWHAMLPGAHDRRNRDAIFPQVTAVRKELRVATQ